MSERSGIEMLEELLNEVQTLRKELKILDQKVAQIANSAKIAEIANKALGTPLEDFVRSKPQAVAAAEPEAALDAEHVGIKKFNFERSDAAKTDQVQPRGRGQAKATLVSGKMIVQIGGKDTALSGLNVKIFDKTDKLVKQTKTNRAGTWMSHLHAGKYVANIEGKHKGQDLVPVNLKFEVKEGMKELEVG